MVRQAWVILNGVSLNSFAEKLVKKLVHNQIHHGHETAMCRLRFHRFKFDFTKLKDDRMSVQITIKAFGLSVLMLLAASTQCAVAGTIPYPSPGTLNPTTYSFTAENTGDVIAYFAGSTASYENQLGMLINGVQSSAGFGLDDRTSAVGLAFTLGHVTKGDTLVFDLKVISLGGLIVYSDPSMNSAYDNGGTGLNHVYSTPYSGSLGHSIPNGTFVGFEDLRGGGDKNYNDEDFVFTNVASVSASDVAAVSEPASVIVFGLGAIGLIASSIRKRSLKSAKTQNLIGPSVGIA